MISSFPDITDDHQWLHVNPERAASGPFGTTIAHGYLTLSLATALLWDVLEIPDARQVIDYGLAKARFPVPVPAEGRTLVRVRHRPPAAPAAGGGLTPPGGLGGV